MTRALRRRHRVVVLALSVVLPIGLAVALAARPAPALVANHELASASSDDAPLTAAWQGSAGNEALRVETRVGWTATQSAATTTPSLDLEVRSGVGQPELLAYWSPAAATGDVLPTGSVLLGPARLQGTRRFALPDQARRKGGHLVLFSLAQGRVASALALPATDELPGRTADAR